jgi:hypothetical protein
MICESWLIFARPQTHSPRAAQNLTTRAIQNITLGSEEEEEEEEAIRRSYVTVFVPDQSAPAVSSQVYTSPKYGYGSIPRCKPSADRRIAYCIAAFAFAVIVFGAYWLRRNT